jgi:hypothetical protein
LRFSKPPGNQSHRGRPKNSSNATDSRRSLPKRRLGCPEENGDDWNLPELYVLDRRYSCAMNPLPVWTP